MHKVSQHQAELHDLPLSPNNGWPLCFWCYSAPDALPPSPPRGIAADLINGLSLGVPIVLSLDWPAEVLERFHDMVGDSFLGEADAESDEDGEEGI